MTSQRALLLDVGAESRLCSALESILDSHFQVEVVRELARNAALETFIDGCGFRDLIQRFDPLVIFLVLSPEFRDNRGILGSVRKNAVPVPIIAVVEAYDPEDVFELLKAGVADFITSPLNATNVLPRTWKLVNRPSEGPSQTQLLRSDPALQKLVGESPDFLVQLKKIPLTLPSHVRLDALTL